MQPVPPPGPPSAESASFVLLEPIELISRGEEPNREKEAEARRQMFFEGARPGGTTLAVVIEEEYDFRPLIKPLLDLEDELLEQLRQCLAQPEESLVFVQSLRELNPGIQPLAGFAEFLQAIEGPLAKKLISQTLDALQPTDDLDDTLFEYLYKQVRIKTQDTSLFYEWQNKVEQYVVDQGLAKRMSEHFAQNEGTEAFPIMTLFAQLFCLQQANAVEKVLKQPHLQPVFAQFPNIATACAAFVIQEKYAGLLREMAAKTKAIANDCFDRFNEIGKTLHHHIETVRSLYNVSIEKRLELYRVLTNPDVQQQRTYFDRQRGNPHLANIAHHFTKPFGTYLKDVLVDFLHNKTVL